jgi:CHAD domain-containing protein
MRSDVSGSEATPATPNCSTRELLIDRLMLTADTFAFHDHRVRLGVEDAVHQMRVESRRARSMLRMFAPLLHTEDLGSLRTDLSWAADALGPERDLEVAMQRLADVVSRLQASEPGSRVSGDTPVDGSDAKHAVELVRDLLQREAAVAHANALAVMAQDRWTGLHATLRRTAADPPTRSRAERPARRALPALVGRQVAAFDQAARSIRAVDDNVKWHRLRIAAKHARYAAETAVPVIGEDAQRLARRLKAVTELLGEVQDSEHLRTVLDRVIRNGSPVVRPIDDDVDARSMFVLGRVYADEAHRADQLRRSFRPVAKQALRGSSVRWLKV